MMQFGTERSILTTYFDSKIVKTTKHYRIRIKVRNAQEEMTEYIRFTQEITKFKEEGRLIIEDDQTYEPAFIIKYPKKNIDGSYFIIKNYCIVV